MWQESLCEIRTVWQPIYDLRSGAVWGYEALSRGPEGSPWESADALFELARLQHGEQALEEKMRGTAMRSAARALPGESTLFINTDPRYLGMPVAPQGEPWPVERTILEISEHSPLFDQPEALQAQIAAWRAEGYRIALDDFGSGYAGHTALLAVRPDVLKIDRQLVEGIDKDAWRQALILSIVRVASALDIAVIAEGIETEAERFELKAMGVWFGQGFLLGRPAPTPAPATLLDTSSVPEDETRRLLAEAMPEEGAAYAVDRHRRIMHWNGEATALSGRDGVIGKTCWLSGLDHRDASGVRLCFFACPLVETMQSGETRAAIVSMRMKSGERRWIATLVEPVRDRQGTIVGAVEKFATSRSPHAVAEAELRISGA